MSEEGGELAKSGKGCSRKTQPRVKHGNDARCLHFSEGLPRKEGNQMSPFMLLFSASSPTMAHMLQVTLCHCEDKAWTEFYSRFPWQGREGGGENAERVK